MYARSSVINEILTLADAPFDADATHFVVIGRLSETGSKLLWQISSEHFGENRKLRFTRDRLDAWDDRHHYAFAPAALYKIEVFLIVEKHLGYQVVGT
jgi:hypothetical protein